MIKKNNLKNSNNKEQYQVKQKMNRILLEFHQLLVSKVLKAKKVSNNRPRIMVPNNNKNSNNNNSSRSSNSNSSKIQNNNNNNQVKNQSLRNQDQKNKIKKREIIPNQPSKEKQRIMKMKNKIKNKKRPINKLKISGRCLMCRKIMRILTMI